jgi:Tfp pilus assembly protein PilO
MITQFVAFVRARPVVASCLGLSILLGIGNFFLWQSRHSITLRHENVRQKGEFILRALESGPRIQADLALLRDGLARIEESLLDEDSMEVNLGYFYRLEKTTRVRLVRLNQLAAVPPPAKSPFKSVPFSMQVTGSYRNNMAFLRALETGPRILRIRTCSFERGEPEEGEFLLDITVDVIARTKA